MTTATVTDIRPTEATEGTAAMAAMLATDLRDLLAGALTAVSGEATDADCLRSVRLAWDSDGVTVAATERHVLVTGQTAATVERPLGTFAGLVSKADAAALVKALPRATKRHRPTERVRLTADGDRLTVRTADRTWQVTTADADTFPTIDRLWPIDPAGLDAPVGIAPEYLGRLVKVPTDAGSAWRFTFNGPVKPIEATGRVADIEWRCLVMPMRLA